MDSSLIDGFQVVDSPMSTRQLNLDEFTSVSTPMQSAFCPQMTEAEYEAIGESETEKELKSLVKYLESNPTEFIKLSRKRKVEELENAGLFSSLKCKLMTKLKGDGYVDSLVSSDYYKQRLEAVTTGMLVVHNYAKGVFDGNRPRCVCGFARVCAQSRRCSVRIAERQCRATDDIPTTPLMTRRPIHEDSTPQIRPPSFLPPPPPPPPLPCALPAANAPLKEKNVLSKSLKQCSIKLKKLSSSKLRSSESVKSIQDELRSVNPVKRLRSTTIPRSPGGTPIYDKKPSVLDNSSATLTWKAPFDSPEPMHAALLRIFEQKFRNVRSPSSPVVNSPSSQPFSP